MSSAENATLLQLLRTNPPLVGNDIPSLRASMERLTGALPPPPDTRLEPVDAGGVPAEWATPAGAKPNRTLIYFHGGGYTIGSVQSHRTLVARLARAADARVLSVDYRLGPEHPYPAAVEDAVAAYRFVLAGGTTPDRIAIAGDSAGGGLTAACLVALRDAGDPLPAAGVCLSAWLDLALTSPTWGVDDDTDPMVSRPQLQAMADAYLAGADPKNATASPLFADLTGLPPLLLHVGSNENLRDDSVVFAARAKAAGVDVELEIWEDMVHVWHSFADLLPEARDAIARIGAYLAARLP